MPTMSRPAPPGDDSNAVTSQMADALVVVAANGFSHDIRRSLGVCANLRHSADLRIALALLRIRSMLPASAFFDGPSNATFDPSRAVVSHRSSFPVHASECDARLRDALACAGLPDATWTWKELPLVRTHERGSGSSPIGVAISDVRVLSLLPRAPADFARAFACEVCDVPGSATRQCAACTRLVCTASTCSVGCHEDTTSSAVSAPPRPPSSRVTSFYVRQPSRMLSLSIFRNLWQAVPSHPSSGVARLRFA